MAIRDSSNKYSNNLQRFKKKHHPSSLTYFNTHSQTESWFTQVPGLRRCPGYAGARFMEVPGLLRCPGIAVTLSTSHRTTIHLDIRQRNVVRFEIHHLLTFDLCLDAADAVPHGTVVPVSPVAPVSGILDHLATSADESDPVDPSVVTNVLVPFYPQHEAPDTSAICARFRFLPVAPLSNL